MGEPQFLPGIDGLESRILESAILLLIESDSWLSLLQSLKREMWTFVMSLWFVIVSVTFLTSVESWLIILPPKTNEKDSVPRSSYFLFWTVCSCIFFNDIRNWGSTAAFSSCATFNYRIGKESKKKSRFRRNWNWFIWTFCWIVTRNRGSCQSLKSKSDLSNFVAEPAYLWFRGKFLHISFSLGFFVLGEGWGAGVS